jgi:hypothetical protein
MADGYEVKKITISSATHTEKEKAKLAKRATELLANSDDWLRSAAAEGRPTAIETLAALEEMATGVFRLATIAERELPTATDTEKSRPLPNAP